MRTNSGNKKKKGVQPKPDSMESQMRSSSEQNYEVESILNKKVENGEQLYRVKWKGYDTRESTWQPKRNLDNCSTLIVEFELKKLSQQKWQQLQKMVSQSEDGQLQQQFSERIPYNIYDHNVECLLQKNSIELYKERIRKVQMLMKDGADQPKSGAEIDYIIGPVIKDDVQEQVPSEFRVCLKSGGCCLMSKKKLYGQSFRSALLLYYESLIEFKD